MDQKDLTKMISKKKRLCKKYINRRTHFNKTKYKTLNNKANKTLNNKVNKFPRSVKKYHFSK